MFQSVMIGVLFAFVSLAWADDEFTPFDRLVEGEWVIGFETGHQQVDHWRWGPGERSIIGHTHSTHEHGETTMGALRVITRNDADEAGTLRYFALSSRGLITEGTITIDDDGEGARLEVQLYYSDELQRAYGARPTRALASAWRFDDETSYVVRLLEMVRGNEVEMAAWGYKQREAPETHVAVDALSLTHLRALSPWLSHEGAVRLEAVAHTRALLVRSGEGVDAEEGVLYFHEGRGVLRYMGLRSDGSVLHGDVEIADGPVLRITLDGDAGVIEVREGDDGALRWVDG
jgi:hypothetical protein